ncbi:MAG: hypothetical protein LQ341_002253 [Variospora aurantia]|nr:MAG: hypothetical protein LQ341_002253 [Variospora aurantia]
MKGQRHLTIVIKLGSSSIVHEKTHEPLLSILSLIVETAVKLHKDGHRVIIVSSGAIAVGLRRMDVEKKPKHLPMIQASMMDHRVPKVIAYGSQRLWQLLGNRTQYQNAQNTFVELLNMGVIPIVNENDTLAVSEIRFGDNDTLSAITAAMVQAEYLFLMTDVDCLYDKNPRTYPDAIPIEVVHDVASLEADVSSAGSSLGTGGMLTKLVAARLATSAGVTTVIARSSNPGNIINIVRYCQSLKATQTDASSQPLTPANEDPLSRSTASLQFDILSKPPLHTRFLPDPEPIRDRSFWLLHGLAAHGTVFIDEGAHRALVSKAGLLPVGIVGVEGHFAQQEAVRLFVVSTKPWKPSSPAPSETPITLDTRIPVEVGRALVNYSAAEIVRIKGLQSTQIESVLGYADSEYVALRENVSLIRREKGNRPPATPSVPRSLSYEDCTKSAGEVLNGR